MWMPNAYIANHPYLRARRDRALEIKDGIEAPPGYWSRRAEIDAAAARQEVGRSRRVRKTIDHIYCLVPDLLQITNFPFYWGKITRSEANKLLENQPDGTFLLRDSEQDGYVFTVSFSRNNSAGHWRIEQWNHRYTFDMHDPTMFSSPTIIEVINHYKSNTNSNSGSNLKVPLNRNFAFSLKHLCRATICNNITYDNIDKLKLPSPIESYLKEYKYMQRIKITHN